MVKCNNPACGYEDRKIFQNRICPECGYIMHPVKERKKKEISAEVVEEIKFHRGENNGGE